MFPDVADEPYDLSEIRMLDPEAVLRRNFGWDNYSSEHKARVRDSDTYRLSRARLERGLPLDPPKLEAVDRRTGYAEVVDGQRRLIAAVDLGFKRVPVVVRYA